MAHNVLILRLYTAPIYGIYLIKSSRYTRNIDQTSFAKNLVPSDEKKKFQIEPSVIRN